MCEKGNKDGPITESPDESFLVVRIRDVLLLDGLLHVRDRDFEGNSLVEMAKIGSCGRPIGESRILTWQVR